ncbi:MAG: serine hydrolase [Arenicellales bacterium]|nr:serine hydrolase [Arenicellales bacterium]
MMRIVSVTLFVVCITLVGSAPTWAATARYDVSYLWHSRLDNVYAYRQQVARVLGPRVSKRLKVVRKKSGLYGLIYHRRGDSAGARRVARTHSKLLRSRGLESAAPVRSMNWTYPSSSIGSSQPPQSSKTKTTEARTQEIRNLGAAVERYIKSLRRKGRISNDERTAWSVYDFTTGKKLVGINEDVQFQAASLVKPFFAMAFFHKVRKGGLLYGPKSRRHMERMIQYSNNHSTNWVMRQVGGPRAMHSILRSKYPQIFQDTHIVEYIPVNGRTYRNKASAHDYSRFLYALWNEDIPGAREIKRLMSLPGPDRLYTGARAIPKGTLVYNKTGSTARLCGDMGILVVKGKDGKRYPYTLVGVIEKRGRARNYGSWIRSRGNVIRKVSNLVYAGISQQHGLRSL